MRFLLLSASPRINGNTMSILKHLKSNLKLNSHKVDLISLANKKIAFCTGCLVCENENGNNKCKIKDYLDSILFKKILSSDILVFGSPSYFDLPTANMINFFDRCNAILNDISLMKLRYALVTVGQSNKNSLISTCDSMRKFCDICKMIEIVNPLCLIARDIGDIKANNNAIRKINTFSKLICNAIKDL